MVGVVVEGAEAVGVSADEVVGLVVEVSEGVEFSSDHLRRSDMLRSIVVVWRVWRRGLCLKRVRVWREVPEKRKRCCREEIRAVRNGSFRGGIRV